MRIAYFARAKDISSLMNLCLVCFMPGKILFIYMILFYLKEKYLLSYAKGVDSDQTPRFVVSDLGLHCLPLS